LNPTTWQPEPESPRSIPFQFGNNTKNKVCDFNIAQRDKEWRIKIAPG
jgi:hypothetical protein